MSSKPAALKPKAVKEPGMRLRTLDCFPKAREMLLDGRSIADVAVFIQDECGEYTDVSRASLLRTLHRYKGSLPPGELVAARLPKQHVEALKAVGEGVDELRELSAIYAMQMKRVTKLLPVEAKMENVLFPNVSGEMRILLEILREVSAVKKARGLNEPPPPPPDPDAVHPGALPPEVQVLEKSYGISADSVLKNAESVHRVMSIYKTLTVVAEFTDRAPTGS